MRECKKCPAFIFASESLSSGLCHGCRSGPPQMCLPGEAGPKSPPPEPDPELWIKAQAARFRTFGYDPTDGLFYLKCGPGRYTCIAQGRTIRELIAVVDRQDAERSCGPALPACGPVATAPR